MAQIVLITSPWAVEAIQVKPGDTVIIRVPEGATQEEIQLTIDRLLVTLEPKLHGTQIIAVLGNLGVESLDANMMRESGWTKRPS